MAGKVKLSPAQLVVPSPAFAGTVLPACGATPAEIADAPVPPPMAVLAAVVAPMIGHDGDLWALTQDMKAAAPAAHWQAAIKAKLQAQVIDD